MQVRNDRAPVQQRLAHKVASDCQRVEAGERAAQLALRQEELCQRRRVRQALQHAVHEARVAQVLQAAALR